MRTLQYLFDNNKKWAAEKVHENPRFFEELSQQQKPNYLWIGCSDSRVPATQITGLAPGEVFVHRNIANQINHKDNNCMSVVQFAVRALKVKHIIVCGHYGCGGVLAAMQQTDFTAKISGEMNLVNHWVRNIRDIQRRYPQAFQQIETKQAKLNRFCELNVVDQVNRLCRTSIVKKAWSRGEELHIHGWIYHIENGLLNDLNLCITNTEKISMVTAAAIEALGVKAN